MKPTEQIATALRGDVIAVLQQEIETLRKLSRADAYEAVMNDPALLDACVRLFRTRPELFSAHVVDAGRQPVTSDDGLLSCGRTLGEAVALVVQASARRYFRRKLGAGDRLFPNRDAAKLRPAIAQVAGIAPEALDQIMPVLGSDLRLFVSFFFVAYVALGEDGYRATFGIGGSMPWMVKRYADRLAQLDGMPPPTFDDIRTTFGSVLRPSK